jgi:multisubunit Na+/H+ antiporter MnhC subunit
MFITHTGTLTTKMSSDAENISRNLSQAYPGAVVALATMITALVVGFGNQKIALFCVLFSNIVDGK